MEHLEKRGVSVGFVVLGQSSRTHLTSYEPNHLIHLEQSADYRKPWQVLRLVQMVRKEIQQFQPTLLHSWLWTSDYVTAKANAGGKLPHISHIVDRRSWQESSKLKHRLRKWSTKRAFRQSGTRFLSVSEAAKQFAVKHLCLSPNRIDVALNSIDASEFNKIGKSPFFSGNCPELILGMASRLEPEKGHEYLLIAMRSLRNEGHKVRLAITGKGGNRERLEELVQELKIDDCVNFVGFVDSVADFLASIDVFVVPSIDSEGLPTTILESMAAGRLVVATDVGGATEAIANDQSGLIVPPANVDALVVSIRQILDNPNQMNQLIERARTRVAEHFTVTKMCDRVIDTYRSVLPGGVKHET